MMSHLFRFSSEALCTEDEPLRKLSIQVVVLTGDGLVPFCVLTKLHSLADYGLALYNLRNNNNDYDYRSKYIFQQMLVV